MIGRAEFEFANDVRAAMEQRAPRTAWLLIGAIAFVLLSFRTLQVDYHRFIKGEELVDADQAEIEEISKTAAETR